jgi:ribose transport system substrate-binding protein
MTSNEKFNILKKHNKKEKIKQFSFMSKMVTAVFIVIMLIILTAPELVAASQSTKGKTIGMMEMCASCTGEARMAAAMKKEAEKRGWKLIIVDAAGDYAKAAAGMENLIQANVDAIITASADPYALGEGIQKANEAKIPVIIEAAEWVPGATVAIGMNSLQMGVTQGMWVIDRLGHKGNIIMFEATQFRDVVLRASVFKTIISNYPTMKIIEKHNVEATRAVEDARRTMEAYLLRYPNKGDISAVWCGWDDPAIGAATAIDEAGRNEIFVIGNDAGLEALAKIREGSSFDGTVFVDYDTIGVEIAKQLEKIFTTGRPDASSIYVEQPIVSRFTNNLPPEGQLHPSVKTYAVWPDLVQE